LKNLIIVIGILLAFNVFAQEASESSWKVSLRSLITKIVGENWSTKLLGTPPTHLDPAAPEVAMPTIPRQVNKSTDVGSYSKKAKGPTEYDKLPAEKKRQFDYNFLQELFIVTRKSEPKEEDLANWMNILDQGGSREGVYQALVLDEVYSAMENMDQGPSKNLVDFYLTVSKKYLNQELRPEAISSLNLYSLKRVLTEKSIDLMEHYETVDLDQLYRWYANFSADLGKDHGDLLKSEVRKESSPKFHYEWAKNMPIQHVKSEYIIKLHTVMNQLQQDQ
jgi:hypothetical protein